MKSRGWCRCMPTMCCLWVALLAVVASGPARGADYAKMNRDTMKKIFGPDVKTFYFHSLPLTGYSVGEVRKVSGKGSWLNMPLYATLELWPKLDVSEDDREEFRRTILDTRAGPGGQFSEKSSGKSSMKISLPGLLKVLGLEATASAKKSVTVSWTWSGLGMRQVIWLMALSAAQKQLLNDALLDAMVAPNGFWVCDADIVAENLTAEISLDASYQGDLRAKLDGLVGDVMTVPEKIVGASDPKASNNVLEMGFIRSAEGTYTIRCPKPVVIASKWRFCPLAGLRQGAMYDAAGVNQGPQPKAPGPTSPSPKDVDSLLGTIQAAMEQTL